MLRILVTACGLAAALLLAGCAADPQRVAPAPQIDLPDIPADIRACARDKVPKPHPAAADGRLSEREVYALIARLKASEDAKSGCLARLIALYERNARIVEDLLSSRGGE